MGMKKSTLLRMLSAIEGDPEICVLDNEYQELRSISVVAHVGSKVRYARKSMGRYLEDARLRRCIQERSWEYELTPEEETEARAAYHTDCPYEKYNYIDPSDTHLDELVSQDVACFTLNR